MVETGIERNRDPLDKEVAQPKPVGKDLKYGHMVLALVEGENVQKGKN